MIDRAAPHLGLPLKVLSIGYGLLFLYVRTLVDEFAPLEDPSAGRCRKPLR